MDIQFLLLAMAPVFLALVAWEARFLSRHQNAFPSAAYTWQDTLSNACLALLHQLTDAIAAIGVILFYHWLFEFRLFEIPESWWSLILLVVWQDFCYYWFHRANHRIRWFWAAHVVHHSSERLNFSTAFRQSLMYPVSGMWLFWIPVVLVGFTPEQTITVVLLSLAYQFFLHTQVVRDLGPLEAILNTPSHHRAHHGRNPEYIDKNFGGIFILWDRLFGSFVSEKDGPAPDYGIVEQVHSHNPILLNFHEWVAMMNDVFSPGYDWRQRFQLLFGPPELAVELRQRNPKIAFGVDKEELPLPTGSTSQITGSTNT